MRGPLVVFSARDLRGNSRGQASAVPTSGRALLSEWAVTIVPVAAYELPSQLEHVQCALTDSPVGFIGCRHCGQLGVLSQSSLPEAKQLFGSSEVPIFVR